MTKIILTITMDEKKLVNTQLVKEITEPLQKDESNGMVLAGIGELMRFFEEYALVMKYKKHKN